jgi:hypothetical protein
VVRPSRLLSRRGAAVSAAHMRAGRPHHDIYPMSLAPTEIQLPIVVQASRLSGTNAGETPAPRAWAIGDQTILERPLLAFFVCTCCPGDVILRVYDVARQLRDAQVPVIGGFHTPMEKECLDLLLRGEQPVVICPARSLHKMRVPAAWRAAIAGSRLLIVSKFPERQKRITAELSAQRNRLVADLAADIFVAHAAPGSKTEVFCRDLVAAGRRIFTLDLPANVAIVSLGAKPVMPLDVSEVFRSVTTGIPAGQATSGGKAGSC